MDLNTLSGIEFENLIDLLLNKADFSVLQTKASHDGGIDLIATSSQPFFKGNYIIQCKRYAGVVGEPIIRDLYGVVTNERANKGILITTGKFTNEAKKFAQGKNLELIGDLELGRLIKKYLPEVANGNEYMFNDQYFMDSPNFDKKKYLFLKEKVVAFKNKYKKKFYEHLEECPAIYQLIDILIKACKDKSNLLHGLIEELYEIEKIIPSQLNNEKWDGGWRYTSEYACDENLKEILDMPLIYCLNNDFVYAMDKLGDIKYTIKILYFSGLYKDFDEEIINNYCRDDKLSRTISVQDIKEHINIENLEAVIDKLNWIIESKNYDFRELYDDEKNPSGL